MNLEKQKKIVSKLSPVKKEIGELFLKGLSYNKVLSEIIKTKNKGKNTDRTYKSYTTMVYRALGLDKKIPNQKAEIVKPQIKIKDFVNTPEKDIVRNRLVNELLRSNVKTGTVLSLCGPGLILERKINGIKELSGLKFLVCELGKEQFAFIKTNINIHKLDCVTNAFNCKIDKIISISSEDQFSHLFLDYCSNLIGCREDIETALQNKIVAKGGLVWITVTSRTGKGHKGFDTKQEIKNLIKKYGSNYKAVTEFISYKDTAPMVTVVLKRVR